MGAKKGPWRGKIHPMVAGVHGLLFQFAVHQLQNGRILQTWPAPGKHKRTGAADTAAVDLDGPVLPGGTL